ncbi:SIMPL domain-containing protein [Nocardia callitridis]|uniref:SIMPL domain-containing protein n=1 Tax=Nocardia callitridis TaxID=648753 RepID=A0ABP9KBE1_9NOCA
MSEDSCHATSGTVTVVGNGSASATPDLMRVTVSVESRAHNVAAAYRTAGERVAAISASLRANGVGGADIATSGLALRTETEWVDKRQHIIGYLASTALTVALREVGEDADPGPAAIIADCVEVGGDEVRLGDLTLTFADQRALLARARDAAWDDAVAKAQQYARRAGRELGPVLEITETGTAAPSSGPRLRSISAPMSTSSVPVELGEGELTATIGVSWRLA